MKGEVMDSRIRPFVVGLVYVDDYGICSVVPEGIVLAIDRFDALKIAEERWNEYEIAILHQWEEVSERVRMEAIVNDFKRL